MLLDSVKYILLIFAANTRKQKVICRSAASILAKGPSVATEDRPIILRNGVSVGYGVSKRIPPISLERSSEAPSETKGARVAADADDGQHEDRHAEAAPRPWPPTGHGRRRVSLY